MSAQAGDIRWRRRPGRRYRYVRWRWRLLCAAIDAVGCAVWALWGLLRRGGAFLLGGFRLVLQFLNGWFASRPNAAAEWTAPTDPPVRRILVLQLDHLGDAVLSQVIFPLLHRRYPEAEIHVLASPWNQEIFHMVPEVKRIHVWAGNRFQREGRRSWRRRLGWVWEIFAWAWRLRAWKYDLAIDVRGELPHAVLMWLAGVRRRVGWTAGGGGFLLTDWPPFRPCRHEVDSRLALVECLGVRREEPRRRLWPRITPPVEARQTIAQRLAQMKGTPFSDAEKRLFFRPGQRSASPPGVCRPLVVCHLGAGTDAKQWPIHHWAALVDRLLARPATVILVGSQSDRPKAQQVIQAIQTAPARLWDMTGALTISQLAALLEQADVLIGPDSGPAHLAAAVGTPVVVLFSGTNRAAQWRPRGPAVEVLRHPVVCRPCHRNRCPLPDHPCMGGIQPGEVLQALDRLWPKGDPYASAAKEPTKDYSSRAEPCGWKGVELELVY